MVKPGEGRDEGEPTKIGARVLRVERCDAGRAQACDGSEHRLPTMIEFSTRLVSDPCGSCAVRDLGSDCSRTNQWEMEKKEKMRTQTGE